MNKNRWIERSRFAMIGTLMAIVCLVFLFYIGSLLIDSTKRYRSREVEIAIR